jgi:hypothetical protein
VDQYSSSEEVDETIDVDTLPGVADISGTAPAAADVAPSADVTVDGSVAPGAGDAAV